jgi:hypothetical protein
MPTTIAVPSPEPIATVLHEAAVSPVPRSVEDRAWEPVVATHPTDAETVAVVYVHRGPGTACAINPVIRISHDGGRTWRSTPSSPGAGSGRGVNLHAAIAWGPGPNGRARLYWADMTSAGCGGLLSLSTAYSDDEGRTWSKLHVERGTPPWVGGFPEITVDRDPVSPNRGAVYVGYNWLGSGGGPGFRLLASGDFGRTWRRAEIAPAPGPAGFADWWRIGYRLRPAPDGSVFASWYQVDLRHWDREDIFAKGGSANVGRLGVAVANVRFDRSAGTLKAGPSRIAVTVPATAYTTSGASIAGTAGNIRPEPMWQHGFDLDSSTGRLYVAVGTYGSGSGARPNGVVRIASSDDRGATWSMSTLPAAPPVDGRRQSSYKPNLVVTPRAVVVTVRTVDDDSSAATLAASFSVSFDGGRSFRPPLAISSVRWRAADLAGVVNGFGLRERAERTADGDIFWAYGDGRQAGGTRAGRVMVFGARIHLS